MKSLITALWERSVMKQKVDPIDSAADDSASFEAGEERLRGSGHFYLSSNTSLLYSEQIEGGFGVYLAGNWRFELKVDPETGRCLYVTGFMSKLTAKKRELAVPKAEARELIFKSASMESGAEGCYISRPVNSVYFDSEKKILCVGDPEASGRAIEFADRIAAIIEGGKLLAVYLELDDIADDPENGLNLINCIVTV